MTPATIDSVLAHIANHPDEGCFIGPRADALIALAEQALGGRLPPAYRRFVETLGAGDFRSVEIYGLIEETFRGPVPDAVWITLDGRRLGYIPPDVIIVGDSGDGCYYCLKPGADGPVHCVWANGQSEVVAADFGAYLAWRLNG